MSYQRLHSLFERSSLLGQTQAVLGWDMQAVMPAGGAEARGLQLAELSAIRAELFANPEIADWFEHAGADTDLGDGERVNMREMRREWLQRTAIEPSLAKELTRAGAECFGVWKDARKDNDFNKLLPYFEKVLGLTRQVAALTGERLGLSPYNALLDQFTPGATEESVEAAFAPLKARLPDLLQRVLDAQASRPTPKPLNGPFPTSKQRELGEKLMSVVGFDFDHGRLDESLHPFCGGVPSDVRITTRYSEGDFLQGLMGVLHETGHAMYERQLPKEWSSQPRGSARGMAMHESQSLLIEMQVCRSPEFIRYAAPLMRETFGGSGDAWEPENLIAHYHKVERGLIRVDADEVSYPLHVILRFDIERDLISGKLAPRDLPEVWRTKMNEMVGVEPPTDSDGCMQDIHWMDGAYGYFPAYSLGAIAANQLYSAACEQVDGLRGDIERGEFAGLMAWLKKNVHSIASAETADEILTRATGRTFDSDAYLTHLESRYIG
ncbi:MAG: carboxypeptidase Taq [Bradymonadia bacterium]|jgi:carboxypeptidase Taq